MTQHRIGILFNLLALLPACVLAQGAGDYPAKPVVMVVPYEGGGATTTEFRLYAETASTLTGKRFIVDGRAGAGTTLGTAYAAKAAPDGYTLLAATVPLAISPAVYPDLPYNAIRDFAPITLMSKKAYALIVHVNVPVNNMQEYFAYVRANPGKLNYGTAGLGGAVHLPGELLHHMTNTKVVFIHYKNSSQRIPDLLANRLDVTLNAPLTSLANAKAGKVRILGVTSNQRLPLLPDVPTIEEQGLSGYEAGSWAGIVTQAKVHPVIIARLNEIFLQVLKDPGVVGRHNKEAALMIGSTPEQFRQHIATETGRWGKLIKETGIKPADD